MTSKTIYEKSHGSFLNVSSCGSSIRWGVSVDMDKWEKREGGKRVGWTESVGFHFSISMTDCSRTITWEGDGDPDITRKKLNAAIVSFREALKRVDEAEKLYKREKDRIGDDDD